MVLDCNLKQLVPMLAIFVAYYNTIASFFTCLFASKLGSPEARSISFLIQALFAITSGLWLHNGDSAIYRVIEWIQYINPQYWTVSSLISQNVYNTGECMINGSGNICLVTSGDVFESHVRLMEISSVSSILALIGLWTGIRIIQFMILSSKGFRKNVAAIF